ncbi:MAG: hypothetical protein D6731_06885 [Planctomycetota bacterium]|nr:MAG: hypothetical protein D6731_06885 [Planctomycetota bacterium]
MSGAGATSPVITLLTDFGTRDVYAGVMRGVIANLAPRARVIDLTHEVRPQAVADAAFLLEAAAPYFPWGTVHVAVVDPGVGSERRILCARTSRATYLAPDNGLLSRVLERDPPARVVSVENRVYFLPEVSHTFHGRDIFAPVAAHLAQGLDPCRLGPEVDAIVPLELPRAREREPGVIEAHIIYADRFGNLVSDVAVGDVPAIAEAELGGVRIAGPLCKRYVDRDPGQLLLLEGSTGLLEVSVNQGSAQEALGAAVGDELILRLHSTERSEVS